MPEISLESLAESENETENGLAGFLSRSEAAKKIGISVSKLRTLEAMGRIPKPKNVPGYNVPVFAESIITDYLQDQGGEQTENALGDLLRAARDLLLQEQQHSAKMFDKHLSGFADIYNLLKENIVTQHTHIMALEKQAFDMREAADKVLNFEHERKMAEMKESRKEAMQAQAIKSIMGFAGPFLQKKLGVDMPVPPQNETQEQLLGQAVIGMLLNMTDEKFASLEAIVGAEAHTILSGVRMQAKGTS